MVYYGEKIRHHPASEEGRRLMPPGIAEGEAGHAPPEQREYRRAARARHGTSSRAWWTRSSTSTVSPELPHHNPKTTGISHAFGHIYRQVMRDKVIPNVPIYQNTFFPPNQPTARRSYNFGKIVGDAIRSWESDARVVGFRLGRHDAFRHRRGLGPTVHAGDAREGRRVPLTASRCGELQSGTSELKSWISVAGADGADGDRISRGRVCTVLSLRSGNRHGAGHVLVGREVTELESGAPAASRRVRAVRCARRPGSAARRDAASRGDPAGESSPGASAR